MDVQPQVNMEAVKERAAALANASELLIATGLSSMLADLLAQELADAFTQGFYAGIEAWDLAHRANGPASSPESPE